MHMLIHIQMNTITLYQWIYLDYHHLFLKGRLSYIQLFCINVVFNRGLEEKMTKCYLEIKPKNIED